jgi:hypothetical protein
LLAAVVLEFFAGKPGIYDTAAGAEKRADGLELVRRKLVRDECVARSDFADFALGGGEHFVVFVEAAANGLQTGFIPFATGVIEKDLAGGDEGIVAARDGAFEKRFPGGIVSVEENTSKMVIGINVRGIESEDFAEKRFGRGVTGEVHRSAGFVPKGRASAACAGMD